MARKILFWTHLLAGCLAGIVILIMSVTGVLLAYERQINDWANRGYRSAPPVSTQRLSVDALLAKVKESQPAAPTGITLKADPAEPVQFSFGREKTIYVNAYTGEVLGEGSSRLHAFFSTVEDWHRWLGVSAKQRPVGRAITGACNLAFLIIVVTGPFLWWPKRWSWKNIKAILLFRGGLNGKARDFNWHNVIGIWSMAPLFFIVLTGVIMSYPWANNLLYRMTGNEPPPPGQQGPPGGGGPQMAGRRRPEGVAVQAGRLERENAGGERHNRNGQSGPRNWERGPRQGEAREAEKNRNEQQVASETKREERVSLGPMFERAQQQVTGWKSISLRIPPSPEAPLSVSIDQGEGGRPDLRSQLVLNAKNGEVIRAETFSNYNAGRRLRMWGRFVHTGEAGGWMGQTIAMLVSAGGAVLVWTGIALALRRFLAWRKRTSSGSAKEVVLEEAKA
jgi:uncharacterized iron-regulated membrane protein